MCQILCAALANILNFFFCEVIFCEFDPLFDDNYIVIEPQLGFEHQFRIFYLSESHGGFVTNGEVHY